jgi:uncharacterized membrane protein
MPLSPVLEQNIRALMERREDEVARSSVESKIAGAVTAFTGSMRFVYLHLALFGFWILANLGWIPGIEPWDPSMVVLAMIASVEAIFLSTFVLISQNRMAEADDKRADLNLQISLLTEHETTKLVAMVAAVAAKLEVETEADNELGDLKQDVAPEAVLDKIEDHAEKAAAT